MLSAEEKQQLIDLGYSEDEAAEMRVELAQAVLERRTRRPWGEAEMPAAWRDEAVREARLLEKEAAAQPPQPQVEDSGPDFVTVVAGTVALFGLLLAGIMTLSPPSPGSLPPVFDQPPSEASRLPTFSLKS
mmetsp:Transcript_45840/g.108922  ORF Transcript_45840/g.108922 Transcript_45840/m.108922 type:complete len:131 (+) Transcript_45840:31-423(+)